MASPSDAASAQVRVGLISDTHGLLRPEVFRHLEGVRHILHAGDVGSLQILDELGAVAPVTAVWGNTDGFDIRSRIHETAVVELAGRRVLIVHGHQLGVPSSAGLLQAYPQADIIVFGHTHRPAVERIGGRLAVNPGAAGPARFKLRPSIGLLTLSDAGEDVRILEL